MKLDAITIAALAVAGLAVATYARTRGGAQPGTPILGGVIDTHAAATDQVWGIARDQRQASGASLPVNTEYLRYWDSPMASTIYGTGGLGD